MFRPRPEVQFAPPAGCGTGRSEAAGSQRNPTTAGSRALSRSDYFSVNSCLAWHCGMTGRYFGRDGGALLSGRPGVFGSSQEGAHPDRCGEAPCRSVWGPVFVSVCGHRVLRGARYNQLERPGSERRNCITPRRLIRLRKIRFFSWMSMVDWAFSASLRYWS